MNRSTRSMLPTLNPKFVYFDLDDTLLDHRKAEKKALGDLRTTYAEVLTSFGQEMVEETYHAGNVKLWHAYAEGKLTKEQLRVRRFEQLLDKLSITSLNPEEVGSFYIERYTNYWEYCAGARESFFAIADQYPVGVLTNGFAQVQHRKLAQFTELRERLTTCVISEEFGYMKPHPMLFAHAAQLAETAPEDIVYIGDSWRSDVEGGQNAGWDVIWYAPNESKAPANVFHARSWPQITAMLT